MFFLEWDRGTQQRARLRMKVRPYQNYFSGRRGARSTHVLFVVPSAGREDQVRKEIAEGCRFWTTTAERGGQFWRAAGTSSRLIGLADLATLGSPRRFVDWEAGLVGAAPSRRTGA